MQDLRLDNDIMGRVEEIAMSSVYISVNLITFLSHDIGCGEGDHPDCGGRGQDS